MNGTPCSQVVFEHGITCTSSEAIDDPREAFRVHRAQTSIQKQAVNRQAGKRVENGAPCSTVAAEHEILFPEALEELERRAVQTVGRQMIERGDGFERVVAALGIELK